MTANVFSIEEFSTYDGPGIRTSVFFKGCPLRCKWCHNPEGQSFEREYMRSPNGCLQCGACLSVARDTPKGKVLTEQSVQVCPKNLVRRSGEEYTPQSLAEKLLKNADILSTLGGITFSGGEPLAHADFIVECVKACKGRLHIALQTSGFAEETIFKKVVDVCDFVLYDIKLMDDNAHRLYCGVSNRSILANYRLLVKLGVPFVTRLPLIPTVTDTQENISAIAQFLCENGVDYIEVLPYNPYAPSKYANLLRTDAPCFDVDKGTPIEKVIKLFENYGVRAVKI